MTIVYPGAPGAFAHAAAVAFAAGKDVAALPTFAAVAAQLAAGKVELGVLPIRNSIIGELADVRTLIDEHSLRSLELIDLPIRLHLMGRPGCEFEKIERI